MTDIGLPVQSPARAHGHVCACLFFLVGQYVYLIMYFILLPSVNWHNNYVVYNNNNTHINNRKPGKSQGPDMALRSFFG